MNNYAVVVHGSGLMVRVFGPLSEGAADNLAADLRAAHPRYHTEVRPMWDAADAGQAVTAMPPRVSP